MKRHGWRWIVAGAVLAFLLLKQGGRMWARILAEQRIRSDASGDGNFGASRGDRLHVGVDLLAEPGEPVRSPIDGRYIRRGYPYRGDDRYFMAVLHGEGLEVRIMYVEPLASLQPGDPVRRGEIIGKAQNVAAKYGAPMRPHIHVEARRIVGAEILNPAPFLGLA